MRWCCFLFWCWYRFILALLAHFNWFTSIYVNCAYFVLWKSYDLLWFWMHLILCLCFKPLRTKNYLIVWCNLIYKRITLYRNNTYKEIYMIEYGKSQKSKRDQKSNKINEADLSDEEREEQESNSDDQDDAMKIERTELEKLDSGNLKISNAKSLAAVIRDEEERECMKQIFLSEPVSSSSDGIPIPPPRLKKEAATLREKQNLKSDSQIPVHRRWNRFDIRDMILKPLNCCKQCGYCASCTKERHPLGDVMEMESDRAGNVSDTGSQVKLIGQIRRYLPLTQDKRDLSVVEDGIDILFPDFTNKRDLNSPKKILMRQKRDRRLLEKRLLARKRAELAIIAKYEAKQRTISNAIELLLQMLQMVTSFAILVGNIRKTFIPAHFNWLKHGLNSSSTELMILWRCTVFLDVLLFWTSAIWAYCLQWHLCCRLGFTIVILFSICFFTNGYFDCHCI
ncbi:ATP-dependent zinc metalloprotease FTSH, chloroplastic [Dirofilaria immitis]